MFDDHLGSRSCEDNSVSRVEQLRRTYRVTPSNRKWLTDFVTSREPECCRGVGCDVRRHRVKHEIAQDLQQLVHHLRRTYVLKCLHSNAHVATSEREGENEHYEGWGGGTVKFFEWTACHYY